MKFTSSVIFSPCFYCFVFVLKFFILIFTDQTNPNSTTDETLFILHGFPTSSFDFHLVFPNLTKVFRRIIAPDFIGFGFSSKPRSYDYSVNDQAILVTSLMNQLNIKEAHFLAHDYGDSVAQELLARRR